MGAADTNGRAQQRQVANHMADAAAATIMPFFRASLQVENKTPDQGFDPVTIADREAELAIREVIEHHFPDDGILGEEFGEKSGQSGLTWILDPIDGTRAFITGMPLWGTLIGLHDGERTVLGVVDQPYLKERYIGSDAGSQLFVDGQLERSLVVRPCAELSQAVLMCTTPDMFAEAELTAFDRVRQQTALTRFGGDCYAYCMLASGYVDIVIESGLQPYDIQPLIPLVEGAGGKVTDWQGDQVKSGGAIVASGDQRCHEEAVALLQNINR